jgi:putative PIN family toxin of toxin-antitoxin system
VLDDGITYDTRSMTRVVIDTTMFVSALRSRRGASHELLLRVGRPEFEICLSVPLVLEYEDAGRLSAAELGLDEADVDDIIDYLCSVARLRKIHFLWRPLLRDAGDDHVLELAVEAGCDTIVTHNTRHFEAAGRFGIKAVTPGDFLRSIGGPE